MHYFRLPANMSDTKQTTNTTMDYGDFAVANFEDSFAFLKIQLKYIVPLIPYHVKIDEALVCKINYRFT